MQLFLRHRCKAVIGIPSDELLHLGGKRILVVAFLLVRRSAHHVSKWSTQPRIVKLHKPSRSTTNEPVQRSFGRAVKATKLQVGSSSCLYSSSAETWSCPSEKIAAETSIRSPTYRRAGY